MSLETAVQSLLILKRAEEEARKERIASEEIVASMIPCPEQGSKTVTLEDGTKITVTRGYNYSAECQEIQNYLGPLAPVKTKTVVELDVKGYEWFRENRPEEFKWLFGNVTATPKKTSVSVKVK